MIELKSLLKNTNVLTGVSNNLITNFTILNLDLETLEVDHYSYWGWGWDIEYYENSPYEDMFARRRVYVKR